MRERNMATRKAVKKKMPPPGVRPKLERKFVRIISSPWDDDEGRRRSNLIGLTEDGRVLQYRFARNGDGGWQELDGDYVPEYDENSERAVSWR